MTTSSEMEVALRSSRQMKPLNPSQSARLAPSLQVALTFIGAHIPEDVRATKVDAIARAHKSLEAPADADEQIAGLLWAIDFIMTHHEGAGPPELGEAFMLLDELKLAGGRSGGGHPS
jgi:hypothetical protein